MVNMDTDVQIGNGIGTNLSTIAALTATNNKSAMTNLSATANVINKTNGIKMTKNINGINNFKLSQDQDRIVNSNNETLKIQGHFENSIILDNKTKLNNHHIHNSHNNIIENNELKTNEIIPRPNENRNLIKNKFKIDEKEDELKKLLKTTENNLEINKIVKEITTTEIKTGTTTKIDQNKSKDKTEQQQQQQKRKESWLRIVARRFVIHLILGTIRTIVNFYDIVTLPIYYYCDNVSEIRHSVERVVRSERCKKTGAWHQVNMDKIHYKVKERIYSFATYDQMLDASFELFKNNPCYAYREVERVVNVKRQDGSGKSMRQVQLSKDYNWVKYSEFKQQIQWAMSGFIHQGISKDDVVMLFADTRPEWQISAQALLRIGATVGTMYATLGTDGICHSINETKVTHCVTQREFVDRLERLRDRLPMLKKIIYFESSISSIRALNHSDSDNDNTTQLSKINDGSSIKDLVSTRFDLVSFTQMLAHGKREPISPEELSQRRPSHGDQRAVIMYTSGSTGRPKGVIITHNNILSVVEAFSYVTKDFVHDAKNNSVCAYLPLAHIFEFSIQSMLLFHGVRFGFSSPQTLTDKSPGLLPGQKGDLTLLKPTILIIVPLILDRIVQSVKQTLREQGQFKSRLVSWLIEYKSYWQQHHYRTRIVDRVVCKKIAAALGGNLRYMICGSAPLAPETQQFIRSAFNLKLPQGFGTTETSAATSCQLFDDYSTGNVGLPVCNGYIKLEPWEEGQYFPEDKPWPRGEIVVGGPMIAAGYFGTDEATKQLNEETFYTDSNGIKWYRTGDIGAILPNGNLKIIDRKKDLVKLQNGEYISLGKVESTLKSNRYLDNFCAYADSRYNYIVACGPVNESAVTKLANEIVQTVRATCQVNNDDKVGDSNPKINVNNIASGFNNVENNEQLVNELEQLLKQRSDQLKQSLGLRDRRGSQLSIKSGELIGGEMSWLEKVCSNQLVINAIYDSLIEQAKEANLQRLEIPLAFLPLADEWTAETGLVTAALKIRRAFIYKHYEHQLAQMYSQVSQQRPGTLSVSHSGANLGYLAGCGHSNSSATPSPSPSPSPSSSSISRLG